MFIRTMKAAAGILGLTGVALGAFGAHALKSRLAANGMTGTWDTAVQYHLVHAVAVLAVAALCASNNTPNSKKFCLVAWSWTIGVFLFSGSLYLMALGGPRWLWPATPSGGVAFLVGWVCLLIPERDSHPGREAK
jgi:uncharacterized membrane protein YgdD (TMEM256/DUF423 family)